MGVEALSHGILSVVGMVRKICDNCHRRVNVAGFHYKHANTGV